MSSATTAAQPNTSRGKKRAKGGGGGTASPTAELAQPLSDSANGAAKVGEKGEKEYLKWISKQLKKHTKKLDSIAKSEEKIKNLPEEEKATTKIINPDERNKIIGKPVTLAVYKELKECYDNLLKASEVEDKRLEAEKADAQANLAKAVEEAKAEAKKEIDEAARAKILTVVKFLRLAGHRRNDKSGDEDEDEAIEQVLVLVYGGDETAVDACLKLADGSEEPVGGFQVSYLRIKDVAHSLKIPGTDDDKEVEEVRESVVESVPQQESQQEPEEPPAYEAAAGAEFDAVAQDEKALVYTEGVTEEIQVPPPQAYANGDETETPAAAPAESVTGSVEANQAAKEVEFEASQEQTSIEAGGEFQESSEVPTTIEAATLPTTNGGITGESWADDQPKTPEANDEFQNVERRGGRGRGPRGDRGQGRGRGRGYRGDKGGFRGDRGERGERGGYRGRGGYHRGEGGERGDRPHRPRPRNNPDRQQPQQTSSTPAT